MSVDLGDLNAFVTVTVAGGFREAARMSGRSASGFSEAVRRLESQLGVRLLHRTTRSVAPTEAGRRLLERLQPALREVDSAIDGVGDFRDRPAGTLKLNVPMSASRLVLPAILPASSPLSRKSGSKCWSRTVSSICSPRAVMPASVMTSGLSRT